MSDLVEFQRRPVADVIEAVEDLLEAARRGRVRGVCVAYITDDGCATTAYIPGDGSHAELHWALSCLLHRMRDKDG